MRKIIFLIMIFAISDLRADEGMWLPSLLGERKLAEMQAKGMKLSAEDIYDVNKASLKDAVVRFGNGCTGELISDEGLLLTNYHCGYGQIQAHSSTKKNLFDEGFAATNRDEELPNKGLTVTRLVRMDDVTEQMLRGVSDETPENERRKKIAENRTRIILEAGNDKGQKASIESMFSGNMYFLFVYEVFSDVRLVFAPPETIGKFGGDTDNWVWPRHTGDFCIFRVYADRDNNPAPYSADNVPYRPLKSLVISTEGVREGDFTMVYGFPGRTSEYLVSDGVQYIVESNPHKIQLRAARLEIFDEEMKRDPEVRIRYAAKHAGVANARKKWTGETEGLVRLRTVAKKRAAEEEFARRNAGKPNLESLPAQFAARYAEIEKYAFARDYYTEAFGAIELTKFAAQFAVLADTTAAKDSLIDRVKNLREKSEEFFRNYSVAIDRKVFVAAMNEYYRNVAPEFFPAPFAETMKACGGSAEAWAAEVFENSLFVSPEKTEALLQSSADEMRKALNHDPASELQRAFRGMYEKSIAPRHAALSVEIERLYRIYLKEMRNAFPSGSFYPDANSTMRIAFGTVGGYSPADGMVFTAATSLNGIMQKNDTGLPDYDIPPRLRELYEAKDFGRMERNGSVPVAFIANNHTTGGNSGSPVLNARGELVGLNFDRTRESTCSDLEYDPVVCRNIALDVRFILFVVEKFAGAGYLSNEMKFSTR